VRSPRAVSQTAPGRLRASYRPALGPVCEVLGALNVSQCNPILSCKTALKPRQINQTVSGQKQNPSVIYFIKIGKAIKIGFTTNLQKRIKSFRTHTAEPIKILAVFTGPTKVGPRWAETYLHNLFRDLWITHEFFHDDWLIREFLDLAERHSLRFALKWINDWQEARRRPQPKPKPHVPPVSIYPEEWNKARLEANRRKQEQRGAVNANV
jgi:hypothetical protein